LKALVKGTAQRRGAVNIHGAKNSILPLVCSSILFSNSSFHNVPDIQDLTYLLEILKVDLGIKSFRDSSNLHIRSAGNELHSVVLSHKFIGSIRYSTLLMGALLGSGVESVTIPISGGCSSFGDRPIDIHLSGFEKLGYSVVTSDDSIEITRTPLINTSVNFTLSFASVGATINLVMAALGRSGTTVISNIAMEPEVSNVIEYLCKRTKRISLGDGFVEIYSALSTGINDNRNEINWSVMPDRIEAVSYLILGALSSGCEINNIEGLNLTGVAPLLDEIGIDYYFQKNKIIVNPSKILIKPVDAQTGTFPSLNTDYQPFITVALLFANGISSIADKIYPKRFSYLKELHESASFEILKFEDGKVTIKGSKELTFSGNNLYAHDLRAGFCMCLMASLFEQNVIIENFDQVKRGYSNITENFKSFGVDLTEES